MPPGRGFFAPCQRCAFAELSFRRMASAGEIKCGGTPCGTSGLRALPGHDRPYIPTSGFLGEALTPLLCGPYGQSQSPNRPDLHGRPVKSNAGDPVVRNRKMPDSSSGSAIYDSRERTVLMRPSCIQGHARRMFHRFAWLHPRGRHRPSPGCGIASAFTCTPCDLPAAQVLSPVLRYRWSLETGFKNRTHVRVRVS